MQIKGVICGIFFFFFNFFLQNKYILGNFVDWLWGLGWVLNTWFDRKFSEEQFSTLVFFHINAYSARYLQTTVGEEGQTPIKKKQKAAGVVSGIFSMFFSDTNLHHFQQSDPCPHGSHFFFLFAYTKI